MKVAVISDTHGLLRPEVLEKIMDCELILHGGDINRKDIIDSLKQIAPLIVVRGNNDKEWAEGVPLFESFSIGGVHVYMTHKKKDLPEDLCSCGPRKTTQPITMAVLYVEEDGFTVEKIDIPHPDA